MRTSLYNSDKRYETALFYRAKETTNDKIQPYRVDIKGQSMGKSHYKIVIMCVNVYYHMIDDIAILS